MGCRDILTATEPDTKRAILGVIAIARGLRTHGRFLVTYSEEELLAIDAGPGRAGSEMSEWPTIR